MANRSYEAGRRLEYGRRKHWQKRGYLVLRSAGSHGFADLVGIHKENPNYPVEFIQVKRAPDMAAAKRLIEAFKASPPLLPSKHYHLVLDVQIKGTKDVLSVTV